MKKGVKKIFILSGALLAVTAIVLTIYLASGNKIKLKELVAKAQSLSNGVNVSGINNNLTGQKNVPMPGIVFAYNTNQTDIMFICSDGRVFQAVSDEAFHMSDAELIKKIEESDYEDVLVYLGDVDVKQLQEMYNLFDEIVLSGDYMLEYESMYTLNSISVEENSSYVGYIAYPATGVTGYWYGYYVKEGEVESHCFYRTNEKMVCSDARAYEIVDWISSVVENYKKTEEEIQEMVQQRQEEKEEHSKEIEELFTREDEEMGESE